MAAIRYLMVGAVLGMAVGVTIAFLHLNTRGLALFGFVLTPTISGPMLGSILGLLIGLGAGFKQHGPK